MICDAPARTEPATAAQPTPTAAEDRHRVAQADLAGEHGRPEAGHHAATEQPGRLGSGPGVDLGALARGDEGLLGEGPDAERGGEHGAVGQGHLLTGVVGGEAVPGPTPPTRPTLAAHRPPVEDDEVARRHRRDIGADRLHHAGGLVAEEEGEVVVDAPLAVVEVGVTDPARLDPHDRLTRTGVGDEDGLERDRLALGPCHHAAHFVCHAVSPSSGRGREGTGRSRCGRGAAVRRLEVRLPSPSSPGTPAPPWSRTDTPRPRRARAAPVPSARSRGPAAPTRTPRSPDDW